MLGLRSLRTFGLSLWTRRPLSTGLAILTLTLALVAVGLMIAAIDTLRSRLLPLPHADDLVMVWETHPLQDTSWQVSSLASFSEWNRQGLFEELAASRGWRVFMTNGERPEPLRGARISHRFFSTLGISPLLGRDFRAEDHRPSADAVVILDHGYWQRRFGGDPALVGGEISLDGERARVVGVLPPGARVPPPIVASTPAIWAPLTLDPTAAPGGERFYRVVGRLGPEPSLDQVQERLQTLAAALERAHPKSHNGWSVATEQLREQQARRSRPAIGALSVAIALLLLIACANVANVLLAETLEQERKVALCGALGAPPGWAVRRLLLSSLWVAILCGGLAAGLVALGLEPLARWLTAHNLPFFHDVRLSLWTAALPLLLALPSACLFSIAPAYAVTRAGATEALRGRLSSTPRLGNRLRRFLVLSQVVLAMVLLASAGSMLRSFERLAQVDLGFETEQVLTFDVELPTFRFSGEELAPTYELLLRETRALPGVEASGLINALPFSGNSMSLKAGPADLSSEPSRVEIRGANAGYFKAMGIPLLAGAHLPAPRADDNPSVLLLNETAAQRLWSGRDPVGQHLLLELGSGVPYEVIGVVGDIHHDGPRGDVRPEIYLPYSELPHRSMSLVLRAGSEPSALVPTIREAINRTSSSLVAGEARPMLSIAAETLAPSRFYSVLFGALALLSVVLTAAGCYALVACAVAQRGRELSLRRVLGARPRDLIGMSIFESLKHAAPGVVLGWIAAIGALRLLRHNLFGVSAHDPWLLLGVGLLLVAVVGVASYFPARRAAYLESMTSLSSP